VDPSTRPGAYVALDYPGLTGGARMSEALARAVTVYLRCRAQRTLWTGGPATTVPPAVGPYVQLRVRRLRAGLRIGSLFARRRGERLEREP
jgi:hypothetical protein